MSPTIIILLSISHFIFVNICFVYLNAPLLGVHFPGGSPRPGMTSVGLKAKGFFLLVDLQAFLLLNVFFFPFISLIVEELFCWSSCWSQSCSICSCSFGIFLTRWTQILPTLLCWVCHSQIFYLLKIISLNHSLCQGDTYWGSKFCYPTVSPLKFLREIQKLNW